MPRLKPVPRDEWSDDMFEATKKLFPKDARHKHPIAKNRPQAPGVMDTFALHPELASAFFEFNTHVLTATTLSAEQRHILILRVAIRRRSATLWAQHTFQARDLGLTDEFIGRIAFGPGAPALSNAEEALIRATDELIDDGVVSEATFAMMESDLDPKQILDAIFTVGCYDTVSRFINSMGLGVDPDFEKYLEMTPGS
ncbi:MAG: carboxymuconolactone decarboxylase family protein [Myxococcota bacterium]